MAASTVSPLRLLCVGHSHLRCVRAAADSAASALAAAGIDLRMVVLQQPRTNPDLTPADGQAEWLGPEQQRELLARAEGVDEVLLSVGGNAHSVFGLVEQPEPFDFCPDDAPGPLPARRALPLGLVRAALAASVLYRRHGELRQRLRRLLDGVVLTPPAQIESPPPVQDDAHIRRHPGFYRELIAERGLAPPRLRHKLWQLHSALVAEDCRADGIGFIEVPTIVQDESGYLAPAALADDPTHANSWYGRRIIEQIVRRHRPGFTLPEGA